MKKKLGVAMLLLILEIISLTVVQAQPTTGKDVLEYHQYVRESLGNVKEHVKFLSSLKSRMPGYEGNRKAAEYIAETLKSYGLDVYIENFTVVVPMEKKSTLKVKIKGSGAFELEAYALWPNLVETCATPGITGKLIYIGKGEEFKGLDMNGAIVVMGFDSGDRWVKAVSLGAAAIVFLFDEQSVYSTTFEAMNKFLMIPLDVPRVLLSRSDSIKLLEALKTAKKPVYGELKVDMDYKKVTTWNIIAIKKARSASQHQDEAIMVTSYYDSWSVAPRWAPGADEATGVAVMLEIARYLSGVETERNIVFVAFSGHHQGLAGAREFLYRRIKENQAVGPSWLYMEGGHIPIILHIDASAYYSLAGETELMIYDAGSFYGGTSQTHRLREQKYIDPDGSFGVYDPSTGYGVDDVLAYLYNKHGIGIGNMVQEGRLTNTPFYDPASNALSRRRFFELEPFLRVGGYGFTVTYGTASPKRGTPADNWYSIENKIDNLWPYYLLTLTWVVRLAQYEKDIPNYISSKIDLKAFPALRVYVEEYDETVQDYKPVPNALVVAHFNPISEGVNHLLIAKADENGVAVIRGVASSGITGAYNIYAFKDAPSQGPVEYAPDFGDNALPSFFVRVTAADFIVRTSVFKASSIILFDVVDPEVMVPIFPDLLAVNHNTKNGAKYFGINFDCAWFTYSRQTLRPRVAVYVSTDPNIEPGPPWDIIVFPQYSRDHLIILTNSGRGYTPKPGEQIIIRLGPLVYAKEFITLCRERLAQAHGQNMYLGALEDHYREANHTFNEALKALNEGDYDKAMALASVAWSYSRLAYLDLRRTMQDTAVTAIFFLLLAIPFAYLMESLIFDYQNIRKKTLAMVCIVLIAAAIMYFVHPALRIASNAPLVAISFILTILTAIPTVMIIGKVMEITKRVRKEMLGVHFSEISRTGALVLAASLATRNLRRRKVRTLLTMISATVVVTAFVSTVSVTASRAIGVAETYQLPETPHTYDGLLVMRGELSILPLEVMDSLRGEFGSELEALAPRAYLQPGIIAFVTGMPIESVQGRIKATNLESGKMFFIDGILGLSVDEAKVTGINKRDVIVEGRYFLSDEAAECIVPSIYKEWYNVTLNSYISVMGENLKVVGFFDPEVLKAITDLNKESISPLAMEQVGGGRGMAETYRLDPTSYIIVPYKIVLKRYGAVFNIAIKFKDKKMVYDAAYRLTARTEFKVYACVNGQVKILTRYMQGQLVGSEVLMPSLIILFILMNTGLGAVYERRREVSILSSVGLSPIHVVGIFLAEFTVIGVVSGFIGYLLGVTAPHFIPQLKINTASSWLAYAVASSILVILLATLYPMWLASRSVTPSFERKWKLEKAGVRRGDEYLINIPVVISPLELDGLVEYLVEYLESLRSEAGAKRFVVDDINVSKRRGADGEVTIVSSTMRIKPFDYGVIMKGDIHFLIPYGSQQVKTSISIKRLSGVEYVWIRGVRAFTDDVRKQLLLWRSLSLDDRRRYIRRAREKTST